MRKPYKIPSKYLREILTKAIVLADDVRVEELDCKVSWQRVPTKKTINEVLELCLSTRATAHFVYRCMDCINEKSYFDVGISTWNGAGPDYYLWIVLSEKFGYKLIEEYNLQ